MSLELLVLLSCELCYAEARVTAPGIVCPDHGSPCFAVDTDSGVVQSWAGSHLSPTLEVAGRV